MGEVIDVDSYAVGKAVGKMKQAVEVIDLDFDGIIQNVNVNVNVNVVDTSSYSGPEIIDVDSYVYINDDNEKTKRGNANEGSCSNATIFQNAAPANEQASVKADCKEEIQVSKKLKSVIKTEKAPALPDQCVPDDVKNTYHVIEVEGAVYDAMLTQTNIENNTNVFYVIQVLKANNADSYMVYNRWGIVGEDGEIKLSGPHSSFIAIQQFEEIFFSKTKNHWSDRENFVSFPKSYTWLKMNYRRKDQGQLSLPPAGYGTYGPVVERFMSLICNFSVMTQQMTDIGYDAQKLPLQNLSKSTIMKAYEVLALIAEVMGESNRKLLEELSGEFYTIIPHVFGDKSMRQFIIDTREKLRSKLEMVESLGEIENASKLLSRCAAGQPVDVMHSQYLLLRCGLAPVGATSGEYEMIENYMKNTALNTRAEIVQIFRVSKEGENERLRKYARVKNRMMLWHGSRLTNWLGILSQGLRIAPKEVPLTGASFGRGLYFADMFDKSAMYCYPRNVTTRPGDPSSVASAGTAILLLCEVVLGEMWVLQGQQRYSANNLGGHLSVKAVGSTAPSEYKELEDGVIFPTGKAVTTTKVGSAAAIKSYNEYVVYNEDQVRMRYVVQVNYNHPRLR
ncbi:poly [ADP-ribose] polymerase 2-like isoform X2 [Silene latifolia]